MKKTDSYTAMDDSIPKRPGQATVPKGGGDVVGKKTYKKPRARRGAKKSAKKASR